MSSDDLGTQPIGTDSEEDTTTLPSDDVLESGGEESTVMFTGAVGDPCGQASDCNVGDNAACITDFPNGYCTVEGCVTGSCPAGSECFEFQDGPSRCLKTCAVPSECRVEDGYTCDADFTCYPGETPIGTIPIGGACSVDTDCLDADAGCFPEFVDGEPTGFTNGYCTIVDCTDGDCPDGSTCADTGDGTLACLASCAGADGCRKSEGYACTDNVCWPGCSSADDCPSTHSCVTEDGVCIATDILCSADKLDGYCPALLVCQDGACTAGTTDCVDAQFEPNESKEAAALLTAGTYNSVQLCANDQDWYRVDVPQGTLATVGIEFKNSLGDLDLLAYDAAGTFLGARYMLQNYSGYYRSNETNTEYLSVLANSEGARSYLFRVRGYLNAVNSYKLTLTTTTFKDGADCSSITELAAQCGTLMEFPFPDPDDGFVGKGYDFRTSDWEYAFFVFSNYRWLQLKVILAIRNAIHEVQQRFPGTKSLSLGDLSQKNGRTPGWDLGGGDNLRHPDGSHDDGLAADIAYYQTRARNDTEWICDEDLDLYDGGEFCPAGLTHVVDVGRTAYFLMTLAQHPDFDVVGIDPAVRADLLAEAKRQQEVEGWFTLTTYNKLKNNTYSGSGWEYHFDHMHVWFK